MNTKSFRTLALGPVLFAVVAGLGLALSGCVVDSSPNDGYGYGCQSNLVVDWQIQNPAGGSVTCAAAARRRWSSTSTGSRSAELSGE